ncbi:MAG: tryptophan-rich sensory protein [Candidatus Andersenbacteria bacterium]|nr:tryptophan-rich sensory protein [Candidatus Andersenbacteria bacterium]
MNTWGRAIFFIVACEIAGALGSIFTAPEITNWYATLTKPMLNPPSWVFGPVWTLLYALMGIAVFLIWEQYRKTKQKKKRKVIEFALWIFVAQLLLNTMWSIIFFGLHNPALAFLNLLAMWIFIALTIYVFKPINKTAAYLLAPYILWVTFAGYLNFSVWQLNKQSIGYGAGICTQEAMLCPDGSYVGRTGPQCQFAQCPQSER